MSQADQVMEFQKVAKTFGKVRALQDITATIPAGVTGLLGPNGAGKSTLIKIVLGLLRASSGRVNVLGVDASVQGKLVRQQVGFMPEDDCYVPSLTGVESVQFAARLNSLPRLEGLRRAHEILDFCGAGQERYRTVETYSTGMRQKLKFAQALVHDPPLLILDEPTAGLDPDERDAMLSRIRILARDHGKSVLLCTHILPDVQSVSSHVVILAAGRVVLSQSLEELSRPVSPAMTVRIAGPVAAWTESLERQGLTFRPLQPEGWEIAGDTHAMQRRIWAAARESQCVIRSMTPARNSMEMIFLEAVQAATGGAQHADS
ncbi:MAG: ABC transporter ATP-binding protein [Pirellulaceae bacterium]